MLLLGLLLAVVSAVAGIWGMMRLARLNSTTRTPMLTGSLLPMPGNVLALRAATAGLTVLASRGQRRNGRGMAVRSHQSLDPLSVRR